MNDPFIIYIVDDEDSVRHALSRLMGAYGYRTKMYGSPEQFLDDVTAESSGCVLLDISMPGMTGLQAQVWLQKMGIDLPVIAISAYDDDEVRQSARKLGARFFFRKPVDDQALLDAIAWVSQASPGA